MQGRAFVVKGVSNAGGRCVDLGCISTKKKLQTYMTEGSVGGHS